MQAGNSGRSGCEIGANDGQGVGDDLAAPRCDDSQMVDVERAVFWPLGFGVEADHDDAALEVANNRQVVAGRDDQGMGRHVEHGGSAKRTQAHILLRCYLA